MKDKNGVIIKEGDLVRIRQFELKRLDGTTYHIVPEEICRVVMGEDQGKPFLRYSRNHGAWKPPVEPYPHHPPKDQDFEVEVI